MTYDILWHLMTIVAWSAFRFARKAVFASKALSVSTKNLAGKVRIEMKQHENVSQLMVVRVSSCFGTESPTYDDAKEPLNNWRSNLNTLCYLPYMLIRITFHAKSYVMSLQFDHVRPLTICGKNDREPDWVLQVLRIPFLGDALVEQQRIFRCHSTQPHAWRNHSTLPTSPAQPWRFSVQVAETEAFEESTVPPGK